MTPNRPIRRLLAAFLGVILACSTISAGSAQGVPPPNNPLTTLIGKHVRLAGQITALQVNADHGIVGLTLQLGTPTVDLQFSKQVKLDARSAEADVQGLATGDYAVVVAQRATRTTMIATHVLYDVGPFGPLKGFSGTLVRLSPDGRHFSLRPDVGRVRFFTVFKQSRIKLDGKPLDALSPDLVRGQPMNVVGYRQADATWLAIFVDLKSTSLNTR